MIDDYNDTHASYKIWQRLAPNYEYHRNLRDGKTFSRRKYDMPHRFFPENYIWVPPEGSNTTEVVTGRLEKARPSIKHKAQVKQSDSKGKKVGREKAKPSSQ